MLCALVDMAYLTGQRIGDLLTMEWAQVSDAGIAFKTAKTGKRVLIEWTPKLRDAIARLRRLRIERQAFTALFSLDDQKEGMAAFREKRPPAFTHR